MTQELAVRQWARTAKEGDLLVNPTCALRQDEDALNEIRRLTRPKEK